MRPGAAFDYLAAVREERIPLLAGHGHDCVCLFEVLFCDSEVITLWGTTLDAHLALQRARDAALGLDDEVEPDPRLPAWEKRARHFLKGPHRETLITPFPGCRMYPATPGRSTSE